MYFFVLRNKHCETCPNVFQIYVQGEKSAFSLSDFEVSEKSLKLARFRRLTLIAFSMSLDNDCLLSIAEEEVSVSLVSFSVELSFSYPSDCVGTLSLLSGRLATEGNSLVSL